MMATMDLRSDITEPKIMIDNFTLDDSDVPIIPTSPRTLRRNNFSKFIESNSARLSGNPSSDLLDAINMASKKLHSTPQLSEEKMDNEEYKIFENFLNVNHEVKRESEETKVKKNNRSRSNSPRKDRVVVNDSYKPQSMIKLSDQSPTQDTIKSPNDATKLSDQLPTQDTVNSTPLLNALNDKVHIVVVRKIEYTENEKVNNISRMVATLDLYKKKYKSIKLPTYSENTPHDTLLIYVNSAKSQVTQRKKLTKYKIMLVIFFFCIELAMIYIFNINPDKFTLNQLKNMDQYELILNELQEMDIERTVEEWSPFMRILWGIGMHLFIFMIAKIISKFCSVSTSELQKVISGFINGKSMSDLDVDDGEEESLINRIYGLFSAFTSGNFK